jgi:hypothetical protein
MRVFSVALSEDDLQGLQALARMADLNKVNNFLLKVNQQISMQAQPALPDPPPPPTATPPAPAVELTPSQANGAAHESQP